MLPLPAHPFSLTPVPNVAAATTLPQIAVTAVSTPTANAAAVAVSSSVSPAGSLIATPRKAWTLGTLLAPLLTPQQPDVPRKLSASTNGTPVGAEQPPSGSAQDTDMDDSSAVISGGDSVSDEESQSESSSGLDLDEAEALKVKLGFSKDNSSSASEGNNDCNGSDSTESLTSTSSTSDSDDSDDTEGEYKGGDYKEITDSSDSKDTRPSELQPPSRKSIVPSRRRKVDMIQSDRNRRQRHLHQRVLGSPIFDMVRLSLAKLLPKGKRLLKQGLGRGTPRLDDSGHDGRVGSSASSSCSTRGSRRSGVQRLSGRTWRYLSYQKETSNLGDSSGGNSDGDSDNSEDSGYHPSPTLSTRKHSGRLDALSPSSIALKSFAPVQQPTAGESSTRKQKRARSQHRDDNEQHQSSDDDSYDGGDDTNVEQRPCKRRSKRRHDVDTQDDSDHRCRTRGSQIRSRWHRSVRTSQQSVGTCTALDCPPNIVSDRSSQTADTPDASVTHMSPDVPTEPAAAATVAVDGLARAVQRLRRVIDAAPKNNQVCIPSHLEQERTRLLEASEVVFYNQARQHNPIGSTDYTPVPTPTNPTRNDTTSYALPSAESVSYAPAPDPEVKDANQGLTAAEFDLLKAQPYHIAYNLPDRLQLPLRSGTTSELKTMMEQNIRKRRAAAAKEDTRSEDRRDEPLPEDNVGDDSDPSDNKPRKLKSRRLEY
ncbi:hypothetical protein BGZ67_006318 [Mortierella alpina]|nr:hypothetical protein BGZ67_006318 [Mortierella alpina]